MEVKVPVELVLSVDVPMEKYQRQIQEHCVQELDKQKRLVEAHVKKHIDDLLTQDAVRQYVGDRLAASVARQAMERVAELDVSIRREVDSAVMNYVKTSIVGVASEIERRIGKHIEAALRVEMLTRPIKTVIRSVASNAIADAKAASADESPIEDLELTVRSGNCFKAEGIRTVGELCSKSEMDLLEIPGFGVKSLREVKEVLAARGLALRDAMSLSDA